jgi:hypothetical protein
MPYLTIVTTERKGNLKELKYWSLQSTLWIKQDNAVIHEIINNILKIYNEIKF